MFLFTFTAALLAIAFWLAAAVLLYRGSLDVLIKQFILFLFFGGLWIGSNAVADISFTDTMLIVACGFAFVGGTWLVTAYLLFIDTFIDGKVPSRFWLFLYIAPSIFFSIGGFTKFATQETILIKDAPAQIVPGPQYSIFLYCLLASFFYGMVRLIWAVVKSSGKKRAQAVYIALGFGGLIIGEVTFSVILPLMGEYRFYNLAPQFAILFAYCTGYAILRHQFLNIRLFVQRGLIYTIIFLGVVTMYSVLLLLTTELLGFYTRLSNFFVGLVAIWIAVVSVPYIDTYLRKRTDPIFFKNHYDYNATLHLLSQTVQHSETLTQLRQQSQKVLQEALKVRFVQIKNTKNAKVQNALNIPIVHNNTVVGQIFLGDKMSGDDFTDQDQLLLKTFANQIGTAMSRALLYEQLQEKAKELEVRVAERTQELVDNQQRQQKAILEISHNLQTPLTILQTNIDRLKQKSSSPEVLHLERSLQLTSQFINELLRLTRLESGFEKMEFKKENISVLITDIVDEMTIIASSKKVAINASIEDAIVCTFDAKKIREVMLNIFSNAIKYIGAENKQKQIDVKLYTDKKSVSVSITDNGIGISDADQKKIFNTFYRSKSVAGTEGTGLGLAIVKEIVSQHKGTIVVKSAVGKGSTFTVVLPKSITLK